jgi:hypothetical protein
MYQKDYILRMIEMIGDLIAGILGLIKKGDYNVASDQIGKIYYDMLKQDASFFHAIPANELTRTLLQDHNYTNGHLEILAELFNVEAELELAQGNKDGSLEYSNKSLIIFDYIETEQRTYSSERVKKIEAIRKRIEALRNPEEIP